MEFFLPRSLRSYPGRGIDCIACILWSLRDYPERGNTSVTAGKRSRKASVTRG